MDLVKITDLSEELGLSSRTLRYYEQVGLIRSVRPEFEKYRYYDTATVGRLRQIMVLRKMQIPIRDIIRIYESEDMRVVVSVFVDKLKAIDSEVGALGELRRIVNDFLQTMIQNGVKKISALPLLYEEMDRELVNIRKRRAVTYEELAAASEKVARPPDVRIVELPAMRVLSSFTKASEKRDSDPDGFWRWIHERGLFPAAYGAHDLLEYQDGGSRQPVTLLRVREEFVNDGPYADDRFAGGLFAVCGIYADEDIGACQDAMIASFDGNLYYQIDYLHSGRLRQDTLLETVLSPDETRERVDVYVPIKKRAPDDSFLGNKQEIGDISLDDIEKSNPVLRRTEIDLKGITPILDPYYRVNEDGEAEYRSWISERVLSTNEKVKIPFRADIVFKADEASVRLYHGKAAVAVNTGNVFDLGETLEALEIREPVFGTESRLKHRGAIRKGEYNRLTWIVGETQFAVIVNGEVRYCGTSHPYMRLNRNMLDAHPVIIGSNSASPVVIRSVSVSKIGPRKPARIREGQLAVPNRRSNNVLPDLHMYMIDYLGQNYALEGCMAYLMECLGEDREAFDYWFFSGLTGDNLTQVYCHDRALVCHCFSNVMDGEYIRELFDACGYEHTYVSCEELNANREMYVDALVAHIDRGIPVIARAALPDNRSYALICGYEERGRALLYLFDNSAEPQRVVEVESIYNDWIFAGAKKKTANVAELYRRAVLDLPRLLTKPRTDICSFGGQAFLDWAEDIEKGRFDNVLPDDFNQWRDHTTYVCMLATNGSCREFLERAYRLNPDMEFIKEIDRAFIRIKELWDELEAVGGGFNVTLGSLKDAEKRKAIADKIREFAGCCDDILAVYAANGISS